MEADTLFLRLEELALACLISKGITDKEIARLTGQTPAAVRSRVSRGLRSNKVRNRAQMGYAGRSVMQRLGLVAETDEKQCKFAPLCVYGVYCQG